MDVPYVSLTLRNYEDLQSIYSYVVLFFEQAAEFNYRAGFTRGLIREKKLGEYLADIISGLNRSMNSRLNGWIYELIYPEGGIPEYEMPDGRIDRAKMVLRANTDSILPLFADYIDRWQMYRDLFDRASDPVQLELSFS